MFICEYRLPSEDHEALATLVPTGETIGRSDSVVIDWGFVCHLGLDLVISENVTPKFHYCDLVFEQKKSQIRFATFLTLNTAHCVMLFFLTTICSTIRYDTMYK